MANALKVKLAGIELDNPIIPASGCFGYGKEFAELYDLNCLGSISIKGTTVQPRYGNPLPRIAECEEGLLNAVGLQNPGIKKVVEEELPALKKLYHKPVLANISGFSLEEYVQLAKEMDQVENVGWIEVNVSCPNVKSGGMAFGLTTESATLITREVKKVCHKPVFIKLSPNVTNIVEIAKACEEAGADGLCVINTLLGMRIDIKKRKPILANTMGGFSGPAIYPIALRMVYQVSHEVSIPVIGCGGVHCADQVIEMMMAGATAVQVGSANLVDPYACPKLIDELSERMKELNIDSLESIVGCVL